MLKEMNKMMEEAIELGEIPIVCFIVSDGKILSSAYNIKEKLKDPTAHAEVVAIRKLCELRKNNYLDDCEIFVNVEPCLMCYGAIKEARIKKINYYVNNEKTGFTNYINIEKNKIIFKKIDDKNIEEITKKKLREFFENKRN